MLQKFPTKRNNPLRARGPSTMSTCTEQAFYDHTVVSPFKILKAKRGTDIDLLFSLCFYIVRCIFGYGLGYGRDDVFHMRVHKVL